MPDFQSDFNQFIDKLKNEIGLITATSLNRKRIARSESPQYKRDLMFLAVSKGLAWSNGKNHTHNKYGIYFNAIEDTNSKETIFFNPVILMNPMIVDLPPKAYLNRGLSVSEKAVWIQFRKEWGEVYRMFCMYQDRLEITAKTPKDIKDKHIEKYLFLNTKRYIAMYAALKAGWGEVEKSKLFAKLPNYDVYFLFCLWTQSILDFVDLIHRNPIQIKYRATYEHSLEIQKAAQLGIYHPEQYNKEYFEEKKLLKKAQDFALRNQENDIDRAKLNPRTNLIQECLEKSSDAKVLKAVKDWRETDLELGRFAINRFRPLKESKQNKSRLSLNRKNG